MTDYGRILKNGEKAVYDLRRLYRLRGYTEFKTGKFENYELYSENKDFLGKDGILTFTDASGNLMALKPDVTLSVAKDAEWHPGVVQKIYYDDEVYRMSTYSHDFKEITQTGIECMGDVREYDTCEVIALAIESLREISGDYVLDISHMGIVKAFVEALGLSEQEQKRVLSCLGQKNAHGIRDICRANGVPEKAASAMETLVKTYGRIDEVMPVIVPLIEGADAEPSNGGEGGVADAGADGARAAVQSNGDEGTGRGAGAEGAKAAVRELREIFAFLSEEGLADNVNLDFSVVNDMGYYNGIMFTGFVKGLAKPVLAGGRYDNLMRGMGSKCGAIGFSVSLDMLDSLSRQEKDTDVDVLILYDEGAEPAQAGGSGAEGAEPTQAGNSGAEAGGIKALSAEVAKFNEKGKTVLVERSIPEKLRFGEIYKAEGGSLKKVSAEAGEAREASGAGETGKATEAVGAREASGAGETGKAAEAVEADEAGGAGEGGAGC